MKIYMGKTIFADSADGRVDKMSMVPFLRFVAVVTSMMISLCAGRSVEAQVNVLTAHNDIARTGQNLNETILTPSNVNSTQFGKLFSVAINGTVFAQPLYVSQLTMPGGAVHNVVYVATKQNFIYAFDADSNGGIDAQPLWVKNITPGGTAPTSILQAGVNGTPTIDLSTKTMYVATSALVGSSVVDQLHALDITTGAEKFGGPVQIQASIPGTGTASDGGTLTFNPSFETQRPSLLLLNGIVYVGFGSVSDEGAWHGWIFSYNGTNLQQIAIFCDSANDSGDGIWMAGAGLAGEVNDPTKPYGRMFFATGNGSYTATIPYSNTMSYGMSVVDLDLTNGVMTVQDEFTPFDWSLRNSQDGDLGAGGAVLLPTQNLASGKTLNPLVQIGKTGKIYILDRNNLGGFNPTTDQIVQGVQTPESGPQSWGAGIWGSSAYWNNNLYFGGTNEGVSNSMTAYSFKNGVLSTTPTSQTSEKFGSPSPTPSISANKTQNGIVWAVDTSAYYINGPNVLFAFDANNVATALYSSKDNPGRDNPGTAFKFTVPTIANGKVYLTGVNQLNVYGLLDSTPTAAPPTFNPSSGILNGSQSVSISDSTPGAEIFYTTDGSTPTVASKRYTDPVTVASSETIRAIASATGYLQSAAASATYSSTANAANPVLSLASGSYTGTQTLTITDSSAGAKIYYTVDGTTPTTNSTSYTKPITIFVSEAIKVLATASGMLPSAVVSASYTIEPDYDIDYRQGFADAQGPVQFNGSTDLDDFRLQLTNGGLFEAGSAFYAKRVNVQSFTTDFTFQLSNPLADGITFVIQDVGPTALGSFGQALGYQGIPHSIAIKFDLHDNAGEGSNSTGLYKNGAEPAVPAIDLTNTGIDLHSGDYITAHVTYDGVNLNVTLTDEVTLASCSYAFAVDIPAIVGSNTAYVGFTGGSGLQSSSQKFVYWTYLAGQPSLPNYPVGFDTVGLVRNGSAVVAGTALRLTNGGTNEAGSTYSATPVNVEAFTTDFEFQLVQAAADGLTFVLQNQGPHALGANGDGLGYANIPNSLAIKFDIYNNAGEGNDSTGVYLNGALPTVPSLDLTSSTLRLAGGDVIHVHVSYDGTTLTWSLIDISTDVHRSAVKSVKVNIPNIIGSNTAYVGFTGATGGQTSVQNILDWTFTTP